MVESPAGRHDALNGSLAGSLPTAVDSTWTEADRNGRRHNAESMKRRFLEGCFVIAVLAAAVWALYEFYELAHAARWIPG